MSKTSIIAVVAGLFLVGLVGFNVLVADGSEDNPVVTSIRDDETETTTKAEAQPSTSESKAVVDETVDQAISLGTFTDYSEAEFTSAVERNDRIVLSFSADWCSTCQALKRNLNNGVIPDGLTILELDYDTEDEMKQMYGVTFQHTLVEIDANGNSVKKWAGSPDIEAILAEL